MPEPDSAVLEPPSAAPSTAKPDLFSEGSGGDPFSQWDEGAAKPTPEPPKQPAKAPEKSPDKAPEGTPKATDSPQDKPEDVPPEKMAPKALREAYAKLKEDLKAREAKHQGELETFKKTSAAPRDDPEKTELAAKYSDMEKRHRELEAEFVRTAYARSPEFKEKKEAARQQYSERCQLAAATATDFTITQPDGTVRPATVDDLWEVVEARDGNKALAKAQELFGDAASVVFNLRNDIRQANHIMHKTEADLLKNGEARMQESQKQSEAWHKQLAEQWKLLNDQAVEKYPQWFKADETDEKGKEILANGFQLADLAFGDRTDIPQEKMLALRSAARNQAAGFRYAVHKWESAAARVTELEKELAQYKSSKPGAGEAAGDKRGGEEMEDPFAKFEQ